MFPCLIARTSTIDVISSGMGGTRNGALHLVSHDTPINQPHSFELIVQLIRTPAGFSFWFLF